MRFRTRMIATTAAVALLAPPFLFAAEDSTSSSSKVTAVDSAVTPDAVGYAGVPAMLAAAQPAAPAPSSTRSYRSYPRAELFLGYSYIRGVPTLSPGNRMDFLNGGSTSIAFNLNRTLGLVGDFGGYNAREIQLTGAGANPARVADASGTAFTYLAGPRLSFRYSRVTPFVQALFGGVHASQVTLSNCTGVLCTPLPTENAFAMTAGGGIDLRIHRHLAIRIVQAEYLMTRFADLTTGNRDTQNDIRLSSGLVFGFGGNAPPAVVEYTCSVSPSVVFPGDPITVTGVALNLNPNPKKVVSYTWTTDGGAISGTSATANVDTKAAAPGTYTVKGHVSQGIKPGQMADCSATVHSAGVRAADDQLLGKSFVSQFGRELDDFGQRSQPAKPSAHLQLQRNGRFHQRHDTIGDAFDSGRGPGPITVSCNVVDDKGQSASATTSVNVIAPPPPPPPQEPLASSLCPVSFERDATRPERVDNEAKACLDDVALSLQRSTDAKLALVGNEDAKEQGG